MNLKKTIYYFMILTFIFLLSFKQEKEDGMPEKIQINLQKMSFVDTKSIIENIDLVPLEMNNDCFIDHVDKVKLYRERFFILDRKTGSIFIFKKTGEFVSKISSQGKGPGEYASIADFDIRPGTEDIYILDAMLDKLLIFRNGKFTEDHHLKFDGSKVTKLCFLDANKIVLENQISNDLDNMKYHLYITDNNLNIISKEIPYEKSNPSSIIISSVSPLCPFENIISYNPLYKNIIYHITNEQVTPVYELDFGKNWIDEEYLMNPNLDFRTLFQDLKKSNSIYFFNTIESSNHLFIYFTFKDEKYAFLYDKNSGKGHFIKDYMKDSCGLNGLPLLSDGEGFIGLVNPYEISNFNEKEINKLYPQSDKLGAGYNYILSFIKFRQIN